MATSNPTDGARETAVALEAAPEKHLVRAGGSTRHIHVRIAVPQQERGRERDPVSLALVIDRSGSMSGDKLQTAKRAALAILDRLDERDTASVIVFDTEVDTVLPAGPVTGECRQSARRDLERIEARASTALHLGWLTGCNSIASRQPLDQTGRLARCLLLTDGLANVGETDPERIATEAAGVRANAGIGTSTFGFGSDYDEGLLNPMAVAGGGQFHHLRRESEIAAAFAGELAEILNVAARNVRLEMEVDGAARLDIVSEYRALASGSGPSVDIGDLMGGEERHVVVRVRTEPLPLRARVKVRARLLWIDDHGERATEWTGVIFEVADEAACDREPRDGAVLHWVGLHHAARAQRLAMEALRADDQAKALGVLASARRRLDRYAHGDAQLEHALKELRQLAAALEAGGVSVADRHEMRYQSALASRGQRDHRGA